MPFPAHCSATVTFLVPFAVSASRNPETSLKSPAMNFDNQPRDRAILSAGQRGRNDPTARPARSRQRGKGGELMKAAEYRRKAQTRSEPTADVTLPSGAVFTLRRPPLQVWLAAGKIPQSFIRSYLKTRNTEPQEAASKLSDEELFEALTFLRDAVIYACVAPRLQTGATEDDADVLDPSELAGEDFDFLCQWIVSGSPDIPVRTEKGGEVRVADLNRFRQKQPGGVPYWDRPDGEQIRDEAEQAVRAV